MITSMNDGSLESKSIAWIFSGNLYPADLGWAKRVSILLRNGMGCEDWPIFMSRSSLNSTKTPEILGAVYSALRAKIRLAAVAWIRNLFFSASKKQSLMDLTMVKFALVQAI